MYANLITRKIKRKIKQLCSKFKSPDNDYEYFVYHLTVASIIIIVITLVHEFKIIENLKAAMLL